MKIAGLTWWRGNYGSILQAYALQYTIEKIPGVEYEILNQYGKMISAGDLIRKLCSIGFRKTLKKIRWKFATKKLRERNLAMLHFISDNMKVSSKIYSTDTIYEANDVYDGFICGSDQIWNPFLTKLDDIYWLNFAEREKLKIAYAPSIGVSNVDEDQAVQIRRNLATFDAVSCRERCGTDLINSIESRKICTTVLDPTLLLTCDMWDEICPPRKILEKYIFVYILRGTKKQRQYVERFAAINRLKIATFPYLEFDYIQKYDRKFGDYKIYDASPADFISLIKNSEYVFTDSFHCSIFSLFYHKEYFIFPKIGRTQITRLNDLQNMLQIEDRILYDPIQLEQITKLKKIDYVKVDSILARERSKSLHFLYKALGAVK